MHELVVRPLEFVNFLAGVFLPVFNTMTWVSKRALKEGLEVPFMESPETLFKAVNASAQFAKTTAISVYAYSSASFTVCDGTGNHSTRCVSDIGSRVLDVITPMSHVRQVVGLTETMLAHTDGYSVVYYSTAKSDLRGEVGQNIWPIPVDIHMGIAAVQYGGSDQHDEQGHGTTTSMMGCR